NTPITGDVKVNDFDPEGNTQTVNPTPVSNVSNGTLVLNSNGTYTYTPNPGFVGNDQFVYRTCDNGTPSVCDTATVYLTIGDPPRDSITGTVYHDPNGLQNAAIDGTGKGKYNTVQLYAYLIDGSGNVVDTATVNSNTGRYKLTQALRGVNYSVTISGTVVPLGGTQPSGTALPGNWIPVGDSYGSPNAAGTGIESGTPNLKIAVQTTASLLNQVDFGVEFKPMSHSKSYTLTPDSIYQLTGLPNFTHFLSLTHATGNSDTTVNSVSTFVMPGKVSVYDAESGRIGGLTGTNSAKMVFTNLPDTNNAILVYKNSGTDVLLYPNPASGSPAFSFWNSGTGQYEITGFNPNNLLLFFKMAYQSSTYFDYAMIDAAGIQGAFARYQINFGSPLPLVWQNFTAAKWTDRRALLTWQISNNYHPDYFNIHRKLSNENQFRIIGRINHSFSANTNYQYIDSQSEVLQNHVYYRLEGVTTSGILQSEFSPIKVVWFNNLKIESELFKIFPNPTEDKFGIYPNDLEIQYSWNFIDNTGRVLLSSERNYSGNQTIDASIIPPGIYYIVIRTSEGNSIPIRVSVLH
ncbi:MAG: cadherin-like domain-containing protein, partial [Bacteroidetes bacterium]|nr:cadherin-like domain-containing protein [Bacteroidota bacterium]